MFVRLNIARHKNARALRHGSCSTHSAALRAYAAISANARLVMDVSFLRSERHFPKQSSAQRKRVSPAEPSQLIS
ncbi:hypothetical protein I7I50_03753 [Histoplasma capsulatum G186AR]|uniref:Uncharacterized protein n=1 Tax=Ajellomyces capsulatus TaxID=5037 RepID=A0A8H7YPT6_AJECA|nr:hypothetical protein I7I52_04660 [Histoplasma capsulatum]QSS74819.1 hypothetical protein I7I50_03753 [Histoplasma capsulatum G186AR]